MSKRTIKGVVTSARGDKTIIVTRTVRKTHPLYGKKYTQSQKFHAHDEKNDANLNDTVVIEESKPFSKTKVWSLKAVVERGREKLEVKKTEVEEELEAKAEAKSDDSADEEAK